MDSTPKTTPVKENTANRSKMNKRVKKNTENNNPNVSSPSLKLCKTPSLPNSEKRVKKSDTKSTNQVPVSSLSLSKKCNESKFLKSAEKTMDCLSSGNESLIVSQIEKEDVKKSVDKVFVKEPEPRFGKVMNLVKAFENLSVLKTENSDEEEEEEEEREVVKDGKKGVEVMETQVSYSSFSPSELFLASESLKLDPRRSFSLGSSNGSLSTRTSAGGLRRRRSSTESSGTYARRKWRKKQLKGTSQKPFKLRTEQRGRCKEEEFTKKLQQMLDEEEKLRVPLAQGLPLTIDEPECLVKPPVKEATKPVDLVLHTDMRAAERSEFDHQVAKKMSIIEQYRAEKERRQKMEEEEEIRRLRKELVPKAQPMPYFDKPFVPVRSGKNPTLRKEQKICVP